MKKISKFFSMLAFAAVALLSSCSDDDDPKPAPSLDFVAGAGYATGDVTLEPGATLKVKWVANKGDKDMDLFSIKVNNGYLADYAPDGANSNPYSLKGSNQNTYQGEVSTTVSSNIGTTETYTFTVTDKNGNSTSKTIKVTIGIAQSGEISTFSAVLLGNENHATRGSFYDVSANQVYTQSQAKTNQTLVDFVYYHGVGNGAAVAAPNNADAAAIYDNTTNGLQTWTTRNATLFKTTSLTSALFDAVKFGSEIEAAATGAGDSQVKNLAANNVFAFKTVDGKYGLVLVNSITGSATTSGEISITVKVQK